MTHECDVFEVLPGRCLLWCASVRGLVQTRKKLMVLTNESRNEFLAMDLLTHEIVDRMQHDNSKAAGV
jgi:hypothetical protein